MKGGNTILIVNLFGAPSSGKSTGAAYIFSKLKLKGVNAELIGEFAKDKAWENNLTALHNQAYIFGEQFYRTTRLQDSVDVAVTDSPLVLSVIYNRLYSKIPALDNDFDETVVKVFRSYASLSFVLTRDIPYDPKGRVQTEKESEEIAGMITKVLDQFSIDYQTIKGNEKEYDRVIELIMSKLE